PASSRRLALQSVRQRTAGNSVRENIGPDDTYECSRWDKRAWCRSIPWYRRMYSMAIGRTPGVRPWPSPLAEPQTSPVRGLGRHSRAVFLPADRAETCQYPLDSGQDMVD